MARNTRAKPQEIIMAILQSKPKADPMEIPPELRRAPNGAGKPDVDALLARIAQLEAQVAAKGTLTFKVSEKGALSIYGMGRYPVSLIESNGNASYRRRTPSWLSSKRTRIASALRREREAFRKRPSSAAVFLSQHQWPASRSSAIQQSTDYRIGGAMKAAL